MSHFRPLWLFWKDVHLENAFPFCSNCIWSSTTCTCSRYMLYIGFSAGTAAEFRNEWNVFCKQNTFRHLDTSSLNGALVKTVRSLKSLKKTADSWCKSSSSFEIETTKFVRSTRAGRRDELKKRIELQKLANLAEKLAVASSKPPCQSRTARHFQPEDSRRLLAENLQW